MNYYDVLVVGGGPVGSWVAYKLAGRGYRVAVFEEHEEVGKPACCTGIIGRECVQRFEMPDEVIVRSLNSARLFSPSGESLRVQRDGVQAYIVNRTAFDLCLAQQAESEGAKYFLSHRIEEVTIQDNLVLAQAEGDCFVGQALVIATGSYLKLLEGLGMEKTAHFIPGAQTEVETREEEVEVYLSQEIAPGFFAWLVPLSEGKGLAGLFARKNPRFYLEKFLRQLTLQGKISSAGQISFKRIPLSPLPQTYGRRLLVVGTAAGQVKPTTGGGIYYGLLAAEAAAETLHRAFFTGDFSKKSLSHYEKAWREKLQGEIQVGGFARRFYSRLTDAQIERIFEFVQRHKLHESLLRSPELSFDWHGKILLAGLRHIAGSLISWKKIWR